VAPFPEPVPGLVIRYSYLWRREHLAGREEGQKDRPCAIVASVRTEAGALRVLVLPVTHTPPDADTVAVEIPEFIKKRIGMDDERSWIVISEYNDFVWPGPDLRPAAHDKGGAISYGLLPGSLFEKVRTAWLELAMKRCSSPVRRTE
jgi:hypothetical protein